MCSVMKCDVIMKRFTTTIASFLTIRHMWNDTDA
jgi:hypothetical protein